MDREEVLLREEESSLNHFYHITSRLKRHFTGLVWSLGEIQWIMGGKERKRGKSKASSEGS